MVLFTIIELFNEEDMINHHGFPRKVQNSQEDTKTSQATSIFNVATFIGMSYIIFFLLLRTVLNFNFTEVKVVPMLAVSFTLVYWTYAIYCYGQDGQA